MPRVYWCVIWCPKKLKQQPFTPLQVFSTQRGLNWRKPFAGTPRERTWAIRRTALFHCLWNWIQLFFHSVCICYVHTWVAWDPVLGASIPDKILETSAWELLRPFLLPSLHCSAPNPNPSLCNAGQEGKCPTRGLVDKGAPCSVELGLPMGFQPAPCLTPNPWVSTDNYCRDFWRGFHSQN